MNLLPNQLNFLMLTLCYLLYAASCQSSKNIQSETYQQTARFYERSQSPDSDFLNKENEIKESILEYLQGVACIDSIETDFSLGGLNPGHQEMNRLKFLLRISSDNTLDECQQEIQSTDEFLTFDFFALLTPKFLAFETLNELALVFKYRDLDENKKVFAEKDVYLGSGIKYMIQILDTGAARAVVYTELTGLYTGKNPLDSATLKDFVDSDTMAKWKAALNQETQRPNAFSRLSKNVGTYCSHPVHLHYKVASTEFSGICYQFDGVDGVLDKLPCERLLYFESCGEEYQKVSYLEDEEMFKISDEIAQALNKAEVYYKSHPVISKKVVDMPHLHTSYDAIMELIEN